MDDDRPQTSEEMLRQVREDLEAMSEEVVAGEPAAVADLAAIEIAFEEPEPDPVQPIRPRRVTRYPNPTPSGSPTPAAPRIVLAIAVAVILLAAGVVFAVVAASVP